MNEREREGRERERKKLYCNGWMHVNELKNKNKKNYPFTPSSNPSSPTFRGSTLLTSGVPRCPAESPACLASDAGDERGSKLQRQCLMSHPRDTAFNIALSWRRRRD